MSTRTELQAILVCPDRTLAQQFSSTIADLKTLNIVADIKEYPTPAALDQRVNLLRPDAALLDVGSDRSAALGLLAHLVAAHPGLSVIGLHGTGDPEVILLCMRSGAAEFLHAPFREAEAEQAIMRLARRKEADNRHAPARGRLLAFVPAKGGSGSTTIASNVAHMVHQVAGKSVLLADFDLAQGTVAFAFKLNHAYSLLDAIQHSHQLDESLWGSLVVNREGVEILPAPEKPYTAAIEPYRVHECLEYARSIYECVVVDLGSITEKVALATLNEADQIFLVANPELPTLFLTRKTLGLLQELGFQKEPVRVLVNRLRKREELSTADMEKIFRSPIYATFPEDYASVRRSLTEGKPVEENCDLGVAYRRFAEGLFGVSKGARKKAPLVGLKALFSEN
ncbi:MAG TPA: AAA family ATPase [Bryobacterales bacterium]|nr:AAA family ATPase [Bryobacterales bacterium]